MIKHPSGIPLCVNARRNKKIPSGYPFMRELVMSDMEYLGVDFDFEANKDNGDGVKEQW